MPQPSEQLRKPEQVIITVFVERDEAINNYISFVQECRASNSGYFLVFFLLRLSDYALWKIVGIVHGKPWIGIWVNEEMLTIYVQGSNIAQQVKMKEKNDALRRYRTKFIPANIWIMTGKHV